MASVLEKEWKRCWRFLTVFSVTGVLITKLMAGLIEEEIKNSIMKVLELAMKINIEPGSLKPKLLDLKIFTEGCKSVAAGIYVMDLRRVISMAVDAVVTNLKSRARVISTSDEIAQVGTISANVEREIGELVMKAMEREID